MLIGHCLKSGFCSKCGGNPGISEPLGGRGRKASSTGDSPGYPLGAQQRTSGQQEEAWMNRVDGTQDVVVSGRFGDAVFGFLGGAPKCGKGP